MSIFFDFDVGEKGRRFRRAIDADKYEIELFWDRKHTENIFGEIDLGYLIELLPLAICMIDEDKKVIGFMALHDHPNVPSISPADWELWVRNMFQRYYLSRNTLFIHFMCCLESVAETFFEEALASVFSNDVYLMQIVLVVPPTSTFEDFSRYQTFRKRAVIKISAKRSDDSENEHYIYVAQRKDFCPKLTVRRAVEEDNDDVVEILDKLCPKLKELYGEYYISEIVGRHTESERKVIVAQLQDRAVGVMCLNSQIDYQNLIKTYELSSYFGLRKATDFEKEVLKRSNNLVEWFAYREQMEQRRTEINRLLEWQHDLTEKLGVTFHELQDISLPPQDELDKLRNHLEVLQSERDKRAEIFLHTQIEIKDIMEKLQIKPQNKFEHVAVSSLSVDFKVTDLNMDRLAKLRQDLQEKYEQTNNRVLELRERLSRLWECLDEDQIYRDNFLQAHPGCTPVTEAAIKEEIKRCEQIKRQKIQVFVANMRTKIKLMWDNIMYSSREREEFLHYYQDIFTEDTLTLHEMYLEKITKFYNEHKQIFELVVTRKNLWLKQTEMDARASEPGRYHNRGGNLLREEKERKAIETNLPKIEAQLREMVAEYEAKTGNVFTVDGVPLMQQIEEEKESRKAERHNKLSARKQALTPSNPLLRSLATSPLGKRNRTAAGLAHTAERTRPPTKRQLITGSATKAVSALTSNLSALKRSAISTVKRRVSGRLATKALVVKAENNGATVKRKLEYGGETQKTPKANGSILKHKRTSIGAAAAEERRSGGRRSNGARPTVSAENAKKNPLMETTKLSYSDFKDGINEKQGNRSSMVPKLLEGNIPMIVCHATIDESYTPKKTPLKQGPMTPKTGKENLHHNLAATPKSNLLYTPTRLTRSALKFNDGFATPRAPLSAAKTNMQRTASTNNLAFKTTPSNMIRSKTQTGMAGTAKLG